MTNEPIPLADAALRDIEAEAHDYGDKESIAGILDGAEFRALIFEVRRHREIAAALVSDDPDSSFDAGIVEVRRRVRETVERNTAKPAAGVEEALRLARPGSEQQQPSEASATERPGASAGKPAGCDVQDRDAILCQRPTNEQIEASLRRIGTGEVRRCIPVEPDDDDVVLWNAIDHLRAERDAALAERAATEKALGSEARAAQHYLARAEAAESRASAAERDLVATSKRAAEGWDGWRREIARRDAAERRAEIAHEEGRKAGIREAEQAITPTRGKNSDTLDPKIDFYPFLGESSWDLLKRCRDRIRALAPERDPAAPTAHPSGGSDGPNSSKDGESGGR